MAEFVYLLEALVSLLCAALLFRGYARGRKRLLLWSAVCFAGLTLSNILVFIDLIVFPTQIDLYPSRLVTTLISVSLLLYGLIWESQ